MSHTEAVNLVAVLVSVVSLFTLLNISISFSIRVEGKRRLRELEQRIDEVKEIISNGSSSPELGDH